MADESYSPRSWANSYVRFAHHGFDVEGRPDAIVRRRSEALRGGHMLTLQALPIGGSEHKTIYVDPAAIVSISARP